MTCAGHIEPAEMLPGLCMVPSEDILLFGHDEFHENTEQKLEGLFFKFSWKWAKFKCLDAP